MRCHFYLVFILLGLLIGCEQQEKPDKANIITVNMQEYVPQTSYSGVIRPSCYEVMVSPADGHVASILTPYGKVVKQGQILLEMSDVDINNEYTSDVVSFLENKEKLRKAKEKLAGEKELFKAGVVSRNELEDDQYKYDAAQIDLIRATLALQKKSALFAIDSKLIEQLTLHDMQKITNAISKNFGIKIKSRFAGRWMSPLLLDKKSKIDLAALHLGKKVEKGEVIGIMVDETCGVTVKLFVTQEQVSSIKSGLQVTVQNKLFSGPNVLLGTVQDVGYFDVKTDDNDDSQLLFPVEVVIPKIPKAVKSLGILGMKVQVIFNFIAEQQLRLPVKAVKVKNKKFFVMKVDQQGKQQEVEVKLGVASINDVEVVSGLKAGDQVVVYD